jgi:hypothetical protein
LEPVAGIRRNFSRHENFASVFGCAGMSKSAMSLKAQIRNLAKKRILRISFAMNCAGGRETTASP